MAPNPYRAHNDGLSPYVLPLDPDDYASPEDLGEDLEEREVFYADVQRVLEHSETTGYLMTWEKFERVHDGLVAIRHGDDETEVYEHLAGLDTTALDALAASAKLIELLTERRWYVMQDAREAGASWTEIGRALGMTKQGAHDWYKRAIAKRAEIDELHDAERAQRAL